MSFGRLRSALDAGTGAAEPDLTENGSPTERGKGYQFDDDVVAAVDVAIELGRPLLVSGEPGSGKTELGYAVARRLGIPSLYLFSSKSGSEASELFYTYDAIKRFRDAQVSSLRAAALAGADVAEPDVGDYVAYQALGRAILGAHDREAVAHLLRGRSGAFRPPQSPPVPSVVVIDEIDKTARDFPNDLLREIEAMSFRVNEFPADEKDPETPPGDRIPRNRRPIVIITSNEERQLPDAFLRRCVFHEIRFPDAARLRTIVTTGLAIRLARMGLVPEAHRLPPGLVGDLVDLVLRFRATEPDKVPGLSELLDAGMVLAIRNSGDLALTAPTLAKLRRDKDLFARVLLRS